MNAILIGIGEKYINEQSLVLSDFHNLSWKNVPYIQSLISASIEGKNSYGHDITINGSHELFVEVNENYLSQCSINPSFYGANKHYNTFYINFHNIKEEISTKRSWGKLRTFLAKHIQKIIDTDEHILSKKEDFVKGISKITQDVKSQTRLDAFIRNIKRNLEKNLRDNSCEIDFTLPDYEDIFLEMIFKIGIGGDSSKLVPITQLGDGYISMFVMAVIQAIAESKDDTRCLFLFEEPESFLHENHQEYFYKNVLCRIAEKGHQIIYTTHSDKMIDIFDTKGIIRLAFDDSLKQTVVTYNEPSKMDVIVDKLEDFKQILKSIEPNLNKILFSDRVILVEGPDDVMVYKQIIERMVQEKCEKLTKFTEKIESKHFSETYLCFNNVALVPHHGKSTVLLLIKLCEHFGIKYFVINDWDIPFSRDISDAVLKEISSLDDLHTSPLYLSEPKYKAQITNNWKIIHSIKNNQYHFNIPKLEGVLGYDLKESSKENELEYKGKGDTVYLWNSLQSYNVDEYLFPLSLRSFLKIDEIKNEKCEKVDVKEKISHKALKVEEDKEDVNPEDIPF